MTMNRRVLLTAAGATLAAPLLPARLAQAQSAPSITRLVVGFPPGGSGDLFARILTTPLAEELHRTVIVENKPGAGGLTAATGFLHAPTDGSALLMATGSTAVAAPISHKVPPYNPVTDFSWIALMSIAPFVIAVNPDLPVTDIKGFVQYVRSRPGKVSYSSAGIGTTVHLGGELFKERAGIDLQHVPYRGSAPAITDTMSGQVNSVIETFGTLLPLHQAGKLRILAVFAEKPSKVAPEIATAQSAGFDVLAGTYNLLAAPNGTPRNVLDEASGAISRVMAREAIQRQLLATDIQPIVTSNPDQARGFVASEVARWKPVVDRLGLAL